jgi:hypothetical protein
MEQFSKVLQSIRRLPPEFYRQLEKNAQCLSLERHGLIKAVGYEYDKLIFIEKGVIHAYWRTGESRDTAWFKKENEFLFLLKSIGNQEINPDMEIEMLTDGKLWEIPGNVVSRLANKFHLFDYHLTHLMMRHIIMTEELTFLHRHKDGSVKYDYLRRQAPDLLSRLPPSDLASFVGVSEEKFLHLHNSDLHLPAKFKRRRRTKK